MREEFKEEIGYFDISSEELIGVFEAYKQGPKGLKFVSLLNTDATLEQIQNVNREANNLYEILLNKGASKSEATQELKKKKGFPSDAWEHSVIVGLQNNRKSIEQLINSQPQSFTGVAAGALKTYALKLKNFKTKE